MAEKINVKKSGYFRENKSQILFIVETLDNTNRKFNDYTINLEKQNTKIDLKISDFNAAIEKLDIEKDDVIIRSIQKKIMSLNRTYLENQKRIQDFNVLTEEQKQEFIGNMIFRNRQVPVDSKVPITVRPELPVKPELPSPISKKKSIPSPKNSQQIAEFRDTANKFINRFQSQKTLMNNYLSDKKLI